MAWSPRAFRIRLLETKTTAVQITTILSLWGVVLSAVYMLRAYRRVFQGPAVAATEHAADLTFKDRLAPALLGVCLLAVGIYPNLLLQLLN
mgnify:CR=1 FL=1